MGTSQIFSNISLRIRFQRRWIITFFIAALTLAVSPSINLAQDRPRSKPSTPSVTEIRLGLAPIDRTSMVASRKGAHIAFIEARTTHSKVVVVDGVEATTTYDEVRNLQFSTDGEHFSYIGRNGRQEVVVLDGKEGTPYDSVDKLSFGPLSPHVGYVATSGDQHILVLDGLETPLDKRLPLAFEWERQKNSPAHVLVAADCQRIIFLNKVGQGGSFRGGNVLGLAHHEGPVDLLPKSIDGAIFIHAQFIPSTQGVAFIAVDQKSHRSFVVIDGKEGARYEMVSGLVFSGDGKHFAYEARAAEAKPPNTTAVVDGIEGLKNDFISDILFSPDGSQVAYVGTRKKKSVMNLNGRDGQEYDQIFDPVFSKDSKHLAYTAKDQHGEWYVIIDSQEYKEQSIVLGSLVLGGGRFALLTQSDSVVIDQVGGSVYMHIDRPIVFSDDGRQVAYSAQVRDPTRTNGEFGVVVSNGRQGPPYDRILEDYGNPNEFRPNFTADGKVQYIAERDGSLFRVTQDSTLP